MAREPFAPTCFPAWDRVEPIDDYRYRQQQDYRRQRRDWLQQTPMATAVGTDGSARYRLTDAGRFVRTSEISSTTRREVLARDGHRCVWCYSAEELELDHVTRYVDGGSDDAGNLRTLCGPCHRSRGGRS